MIFRANFALFCCTKLQKDTYKGIGGFYEEKCVSDFWWKKC